MNRIYFISRQDKIQGRAQNESTGSRAECKSCNNAYTNDIHSTAHITSGHGHINTVYLSIYMCGHCFLTAYSFPCEKGGVGRSGCLNNNNNGEWISDTLI